MHIFIDTSSLIKLYYYESDTPAVDQLFTENSVQRIYISEITKIEFASAIWKKVRTKVLSTTQAEQTLQLFEQDATKYKIISTNSAIIALAKSLLATYHTKNLRTLDSIQLASCITAANYIDMYVTADAVLKELLQLNALPTY